VEEVSLAGKPKPSLQGRIYGVFRNRLPMRGASLHLTTPPCCRKPNRLRPETTDIEHLNDLHNRPTARLFGPAA
jgi:hypothetical protein